MRFAICNETFRDHDFAGSCAEAARFGYTGLEVAPFTLGNPETLTLAEAETYGSIVRDHGLEMVGLHWLLAKTEGYHLTDPNPIVHQRTFDYARKLAEICAAMGGKIMVWGSPQQRTLAPEWSRAEAETRFIDFFQRLSPPRGVGCDGRFRISRAIGNQFHQHRRRDDFVVRKNRFAEHPAPSRRESDVGRYQTHPRDRP